MKKFLIITPLVFMFIFFFITCNKQANEKSDQVPSVYFKTQTENLIVADSVKPFSSEGTNFKFYHVYSDSSYYWGWSDSEIHLAADKNLYYCLLNNQIVHLVKLTNANELDYFTKGFLLNLSTTKNKQYAFNLTFERIKT